MLVLDASMMGKLLISLKKWADRIKFAFGKVSLAVHWEMGWRGKMVEVSLSGSHVQKWPVVVMGIERSGTESL